MQVARWIDAPKVSIPSAASKPNLHNQESSTSLPKSRPSVASNEDHPVLNVDEKHHDHSKDSHTARLKMILDEPAVRSLFREYLRANFCEENLSFWLDVQDFKRKFGTTSSAVALPTANSKNRTTGVQAMERHQQDLIAMAFVIYNSESFSSFVASSLSTNQVKSRYVLGPHFTFILPPCCLAVALHPSPTIIRSFPLPPTRLASLVSSLTLSLPRSSIPM
jgi:hypothetical protein